VSPATFTLKAERYARLALNKTLTVHRKNTNSTITGVIVSCKFVGLTRGNKAAWRVVLFTPAGTWHDPITVTSLPR
jgi:hypothetical protein